MDAGPPQSIDGHDGTERGIDAAGESEHHARKTVLLHVVAQARHAGEVIGGISRLELGDRPLQAVPASLFAAPVSEPKRLLPAWHLQRERAVGIEHEGGAVEHELVLTSDLVHIGKRQPRLQHPCPRQPVAHILLFHPIGRAVGHDQKRRPRLGQGDAGLLAPDIFANRHADFQPAKLERLGQWPGGEHALLIKHAVIRQIGLVADSLDAPPIEQRHGVIDERIFRPRQPHQHGRPAITGVAGKRLASLAGRGLEGRLQHQVLDGIAGQVKLGEGDQIRPVFARLRPQRARHGEIAVDIPHDRVGLRQRKLEAVVNGLRHEGNLSSAAKLSSLAGEPILRRQV